MWRNLSLKKSLGKSNVRLNEGDQSEKNNMSGANGYVFELPNNEASGKSNMSGAKGYMFELPNNEASDILDLDERSEEVNKTIADKPGNITRNDDLETEKATKTLVDLMEKPIMNQDFVTQKNINETSLKLNLKSSANVANKPHQNEALKTIDELFSKRHHIATLVFALNCSKTDNQQPKFLRTNVEFFPYFGSAEAKTHFMEKLKQIRSEMTALVTEKLIEAGEEFCEKMTHQAENIRDQISIETASTSFQGRSEQSEMLNELLNLNPKWNDQYEKLINGHNLKEHKNRHVTKKPRKGPYQRNY